MKTGKRWSSWKTCLIGLPFLLAAGCVTDRAAVERNLMAQHSERNEGVAENYRIGCPDIIELEVAQRAEFSGRYEVAANGRINLGDYGKPRVEGRTPADVAKIIGAEIGASPANVRVRVDEYHSQHVLLFGEITGKQRSVPYRGPETVLDLLQRVGGITPGAAPSDVYVVRPNIGENHRPEVYHVDLDAIVLRQDHRTNLRLHAFDQIYVGETRRAKIENALPPIIRWMVQAVWDPTPRAGEPHP
jgi:protein involved in polysaccharide export with SLBB domain